ncbi:MAG: hypothetical protein Q4C49_02850 [Bacillota bacterium]|nr:hypothetical protein [Bacillota bacterium]
MSVNYFTTEQLEGFKDTSCNNTGHPSTKDLTLEEEIERFKYQNKILQQENDFLKRVMSINRKQISKQTKVNQQKKNS